MTSRQVQKLSSSGPRRSTRPAMARWKAWLCTLATPGTAMPASRSAPAGADAPASMAAILRPSMRISTSRCQPVSSSAC